MSHPASNAAHAIFMAAIARDHVGATREFARWNRTDGRVLKGLVRRRETEAFNPLAFDAAGARSHLRQLRSRISFAHASLRYTVLTKGIPIWPDF